jgi:prepilin-type N-terminal cleavage/methylation domain-containing protein
MKKGFTLLEVLVAIVLFSILIVATMTFVKNILHDSRIYEIRYKALNKIDNEMHRLVMAYKDPFYRNISTIDDFLHHGIDKVWEDNESTTINNWWNQYFIPEYGHTAAEEWQLYGRAELIWPWMQMPYLSRTEPLISSGQPTGIIRQGSNSYYHNAIEIIDGDNRINRVGTGDIVGLIGWRFAYRDNNQSTNQIFVSLSMLYPFRYDVGVPKEIDGYDLETLNLQTAIRITP